MPPERPLWVKIGLWGVPNRVSAWVYVWILMALAVGFVAYGFVDEIFAWGALFMLGSLGYFAVICWMDRHHEWK